MSSLLPPSRRHFLQAAVATVASLVWPRNSFGISPRPSWWFLRAADAADWPVADPVKWSLDNRHQPVLARASGGLLNLTAGDGDRITRLVVRRCGLNLLELHPDQVVVHYWGQHGQADLRTFFKQHRLARPEMVVVLRDRKKEVATTRSGDDFLFGDRLAADFPLDLFLSKWSSRFTLQADDWTAAPGTRSGYAWGGVEDNIPWIALKAAWRRAAPLICLNCDQPTVLANFGYPWTGLLNRSRRFVTVCGTCRRSFRDESVADTDAWIVTHIDAEFRPDSDMVLGRRVRRCGPGLR